MKRFRQLGLFQGVELDVDELELVPELPEIFQNMPQQLSNVEDPLQDHLGDPFPEELE